MSLRALLLDSESGLDDARAELQPVLEELDVVLDAAADVEEALRRIASSEPRTDLLVIGPTLRRAASVGRRLGREAPDLQIVFLARDRVGRLERELSSPAAMMGSHWSVLRLDSERFAAEMESAVRSARHRSRLRTTLGRINTRLASHQRADLSELHRYTTSHRFLESILENAPDAILAISPRRTIVSWNEAAETLFGLDSRRALGQHVDELADDAWCDTVQELLSKLATSDDDRLRAELELRPPAGEPRQVDVTVSRITDSLGEAVGWSLIVRDITARKVLERQLHDARRLESLGVMAGGIAHDFNNLLTEIVGHLELAFADLDAASPVSKHLTEVRRASERATDICRQMRAIAGEGHVQTAELHVDRVVRDSAESLRDLLGARHCLVFELENGLPAVEFDERLLLLVLRNLVGNAAEAFGEGKGRVTIRTSLVECDEDEIAGMITGELDPGTYLLLEVEDDGPGMEPETVEKAVDPFFSTRFTGRGLGLPAALGVVRARDGDLSIDGAPGRGTTVRVYLSPSGRGEIPGSH